jgi:hypothetical protein
MFNLRICRNLDYCSNSLNNLSVVGYSGNINLVSGSTVGSIKIVGILLYNIGISSINCGIKNMTTFRCGTLTLKNSLAVFIAKCPSKAVSKRSKLLAFRRKLLVTINAINCLLHCPYLHR